MFAKLVLKFGVARVIGAGLIALLALGYVGKLGWAEFQVWRLGNKVEKVTVQRDQARAEAKVARKDEAQVTRAADTTAATVAAQDTHATQIQVATTRATEVIDERIRQAPAAVVVPDDPFVRQQADEAYGRAKGAEAGLRRTP